MILRKKEQILWLKYYWLNKCKICHYLDFLILLLFRSVLFAPFIFSLYYLLCWKIFYLTFKTCFMSILTINTCGNHHYDSQKDFPKKSFFFSCWNPFLQVLEHPHIAAWPVHQNIHFKCPLQLWTTHSLPFDLFLTGFDETVSASMAVVLCVCFFSPATWLQHLPACCYVLDRLRGIFVQSVSWVLSGVVDPSLYSSYSVVISVSVLVFSPAVSSHC